MLGSVALVCALLLYQVWDVHSLKSQLDDLKSANVARESQLAILQERDANFQADFKALETFTDAQQNMGVVARRFAAWKRGYPNGATIASATFSINSTTVLGTAPNSDTVSRAYQAAALDASLRDDRINTGRSYEFTTGSLKDGEASAAGTSPGNRAAVQPGSPNRPPSNPTNTTPASPTP
jgi:hypothetical protein